MAADLIKHSPADPRTLTRAARDFANSQPGFAMACAMSALHWISRGHGYEITAGEVQGIYKAGSDGKVFSPISVDNPSVIEGATGTTTPVT